MSKKSRKNKQKKNHPTNGATSLKKSWLETKNFDLLMDPKMEVKALGMFKKTVLQKAAQNKLDQEIDQMKITDYMRSLLNYDCLNTTSDVCIEANGPKKAALWGVPATAPLPLLLRLSHEGQDLVYDTLPKISEETEVACLGVLPYHIACSMSPQAVANIMESWAQVHHEPELLNKLRENLSLYSVAQHANLDQASEQVGTAMMIVATLSKDGVDPLAWLHRMQEWKKEKDLHILLSEPKPWGEAAVDTLLQQCYFDWGADARSRGMLESVLMINRVELTELPDGRVQAEAFMDRTLFGTCFLDMTVQIWAVDLMNEELKNRGVSFEWMQQHVVQSSHPKLG